MKLRKWRKQSHPEFKELSVKLYHILGFRPRNMFLYAQAFRHKSAVGEEDHNKGHNERLEFLGDAILDAVVSKHLYNHYPEKNEGFLTNMRSKLVSRKQLNDLSVKLGLPELIVANLQNVSKGKSLNGNALEALIGAIYLDKGYRVTERFVINKMLRGHLDLDDLKNFVISYKSKVIEWSQKNRKRVNYTVVKESGEQHEKEYQVVLSVDGSEEASGLGLTIKEAEENASQSFYTKITQQGS